MDDCIFCKIASGEIESKFVYEDDKCMVFPDLHPKNKTHLLIVPKKHVASVAEMAESDKELFGHLLFVAKKVGDDLSLKGYNLQINVGKEGGQEIFHLHIHLMSKF